MSQNLINELTDRVSALSARVLDLEHDRDSWQSRALAAEAERDAYRDVLDQAILERIHEHRDHHRDYGNKAVGDSLNLHAVVVKDARERLRDKGHDC